jgi:hypothetical protein
MLSSFFARLARIRFLGTVTSSFVDLMDGSSGTQMDLQAAVIQVILVAEDLGEPLASLTF